MAGISKEEFRVTRRASDSGQLLPGDDYVIEPGHDAWVTSSEPFVAFEFDSRAAASFGKGS